MEVTVFSATSCAVCHAEMKWLDSKDVTYKNIVIDESDENMEEFMSATNGQAFGTPVTLIKQGDDTQVFMGFDRTKLQSVLAV
jgi:glutaredoxin